MTEQRPWPPEQSAKGTLRPWHYTAVGYLAALFEDPEEAQRAQRGLQQQGVPEGLEPDLPVAANSGHDSGGAGCRGSH